MGVPPADGVLPRRNQSLRAFQRAVQGRSLAVAVVEAPRFRGPWTLVSLQSEIGGELLIFIVRRLGVMICKHLR